MLWPFEHIAPGSAHHPTNHSPPGAFFLEVGAFETIPFGAHTSPGQCSG